MPPPSSPPSPSPPPPHPPASPAPPAPPDSYTYWRCYLQKAGRKYVRIYSANPDLVTTGVEGECSLDPDADGMLFCGIQGASGCKKSAECGLGADFSDKSIDPAAYGDAQFR